MNRPKLYQTNDSLLSLQSGSVVAPVDATSAGSDYSRGEGIVPQLITMTSATLTFSFHFPGLKNVGYW